MGVFIVAVIVIVLIANFAGQGAVYYNTTRENKRSWEECCRNQDAWVKRTAQENDYYYDPVCKYFDTSFYSDGSLRIDHNTKKTYAKGEYMCDSLGNNCHWKKAGPDVKRPPSK